MQNLTKAFYSQCWQNLKIKNKLCDGLKKKQHARKYLVHKDFPLFGNTSEFHPQTQKLEQAVIFNSFYYIADRLGFITSQ